jgi:cytochrome c biogenesis protein CcmG/thiol:disulfide interchange protein DsbE
MNRVFKITFGALLWLAGSSLLSVSPVLAIEPGAKAPGFSLSSFKGENVSLDSLKGKVVYVDFWATWCGPCRMSLPWMDGIQKKYAASGLVILAVNEDLKTEDAKKVVDALNPSFTPLIDNKGTVAGIFSPPTMPSSFLIDRQGVVRMVHPGFKEVDQAQLDSEIAKLVNG